MRPDNGGVLGIVIVLPMSGIEQEDLFHLTVSIPVVVSETDTVIDRMTDLIHKFSDILIEPSCRRSPVYVRTVIGIGILCLHGSHNIE